MGWTDTVVGSKRAAIQFSTGNPKVVGDAIGKVRALPQLLAFWTRREKKLGSFVGCVSVVCIY